MIVEYVDGKIVYLSKCIYNIYIYSKKGIKLAKLECERCETKFSMKIRSLDEPIDVYHDWLHKIKTKTITPYPNRLENDYEDYSDEENCNDVESNLFLLFNY